LKALRPGLDADARAAPAQPPRLRASKALAPQL